MKAFRTAQDIAHATLFLAFDERRYVTGKIFRLTEEQPYNRLELSIEFLSVINNIKTKDNV